MKPFQPYQRPTFSKRSLPAMLWVLPAGVFVFWCLLTLWLGRWEGQPPQLSLDRDFTALGKNPSLVLEVEDARTGLKQVSAMLEVEGRSLPLVDRRYPRPWLLFFQRTGAQSSIRFDLGELMAASHQIGEGPARLSITARDHSFRRFFGGNRAHLQRDFTFDIHPPALEVLSGQHYITQGGSECILYRVGEDTEVSGVQVGPDFFPGYPANHSDKQVRFCLFGYRYNLGPDPEMKLVATDAAGNRSEARFWYKRFPRKFRQRTIRLSPAFLQQVVPEILKQNPQLSSQGDLVKDFLQINDGLRQTNHEKIKQLSSPSEAQLLWTEAFAQLSRSKVESFFADHRTYLYQGREIDRQDHVGFDLSVVRHYPIEASNDGVVRYADLLGIYGNTILVDHGCGLFSLYGHLSSIAVKPGDRVSKSQVLGHSGATGLAAGDHLHFALFLHGISVNPTEWWDPKWVREHIWDRIREQDAGGAPAGS